MVSHIQDEVSCDYGILLFEDEKLRARFELGVSCAVFLWDDLKVAVENMWGGPESADKREWMAAAVVELFESPSVAVEDIEYRLLTIMEDEFDVTVDTDSAMEIAQSIINLYIQLRDQNFQLCDELYERFQNMPKGPTKAVIEYQSEEEDVEDSDEDVDQDDDPVKETKESLVDEDGFVTVQRKKR